MKIYDIDIPDTQKKIYKSSLKLGGKNPKGEEISFTNYYMELNEKPFFGICGEFQYSRYPYQYWEEEILKIKMSGINIIASYIFWIHHEEEEGIFDWNENKNLKYFIDLCSKHELFVIIRIGPFDHGECRNGGLPDWLYGRPFEVRSNDDGYLFYVKRLYEEIYKQAAGKLYKDGGPIIGIQLENEYMHASAPWEFTSKQGDEFINGGKEGALHLKKLKEIAVQCGFDVPLYTSTGWGGAPVLYDEVLPLYGGYAFCPWNINEKTPEQKPTAEFIFQDFHNNDIQAAGFDPPYEAEKYPYACCEMGSGMQVWYQARFIVPPASTEGQTVQKIAGGCNFAGYYVFHGGSHPVGKKSFMNENVVPKISYDFQAPIGEFGQIRDSYRSLKLLFLFIRDFENLLVPMQTFLPEKSGQINPDTTDILRFGIRAGTNDDVQSTSKRTSGFIFINNYQDHVLMKDHDDLRITLNLYNEKITIPDRNTMAVNKDASMIFPFNMEMEGVILKYSTVQLLTKIQNNTDVVYFFFEPDGIKSEYCFDSSSISNIKVNNCKLQEKDALIYINTNPGKDCYMEILNSENKKITIFTLTRYEALYLYKTRLCGIESVIISNSDVIVKNDIVELINIGSNELELCIFPEPVNPVIIHSAKVLKEKECPFVKYKISLPEKKIKFDYKKINNQKALLKISPDAFENINDIYLHIDYIGDVGSAFINGNLINDNFCNGMKWEIGLKRFLGDLDGNEIYFYIIPVKKGKSVSLDSAMAIKQEFTGEQIADIYSIIAVPEYKIIAGFY
jgi:hypothetical protein